MRDCVPHLPHGALSDFPGLLHGLPGGGPRSGAPVSSGGVVPLSSPGGLVPPPVSLVTPESPSGPPDPPSLGAT